MYYHYSYCPIQQQSSNITTTTILKLKRQQHHILPQPQEYSEKLENTRPTMFSIAGIRFFIEFSSILVLAFLCIMHEFSDVTWAKQFHFDHASTNQQYQQASNFDDLEQPTSSSSQKHHSSSNDGNDDAANNYHHNSFVRFSPESLNFGHHSIGMSVIKTVHVYNDDEEINLQMISISGNTEHFHCSFFEEKILPPRSNTSFQVVFLARQEGLVNNTLYIHSSVGSFQYGVSAYGEVSPFRVRPLIGARVPLNSSFASLIYIYNPFSTPLQLTEMYTSGGGLHLELPDDEYEAPSAIWNVPPYETRPVMKAHFVARIASNHTSYIRIRTNQPEVQLMLPVEVEVSNSPGLYSPLDTLDFGVLRARHDPPKTLPIQVINAAQKSVSVQSIVVTPISDGLTVIDFSGPIKLPPHSSNPYHVAKLVLDPSQFSCSGLCLGKVLIKSKNNQYKLTIPFIVRIIQGELHFNESQSHFFMNQSSNYSEQRVLSVENRFDSAIIVHDIILPDEAKPYFRLTTKHPYSLPVTLPIGKSFPLLRIEFTPSPQLSHFSTVFRLLTNLSYFDLPLYAYQGRLDLFIPNSSDQSKLDMGLVGLNEHKSSTFVVANHNPIAIRLIYWHCNITGISVELVGTSQGNISAISQRIEPSSTESSPSPSRSELRLLEPNHFAVFRVHVNKLSKEGSHYGIISIMTAYEKLTVPLTIKVLSGSLTADQVIMPKSFPGKIVKSMLNIKSNYSSNIKIKGAFIEPKDDRFKIKLIDQLIKPGHDNQVQITFDASAACSQKLCYTALDVEKEVGHLWLLGSGLYSDTAYIDKELYKLLRNQWLIISDTDRNPTVNVRLQIDGFGSFVAPVQAQQHWPRLANKLVIRFPSIRVGQKVTKELMIENTADRQVLVQAINVIDYPNSEILLQLTSNSIFHQQWSKSDLQSIQSAIRNGHNRSAFSLHNNTIASNSQVQRITEWLGVEPNANSYIMLLPPGVRHRLAITFNPSDEKNYTSLLILRNNLTIIDVVMLRGEGGRGLLKIGKTLPNTSNSRLVLDFHERTLERRCRNLVMAKSSTTGTSSTTTNSKSTSSSSSTSSTVGYNTLVMRERFKAVNIGRMALQIRNFLIDGMPCEGHGFRISRCEPILLSPNQTFDIEILYSPDFTQHSITHELTIMIDDDSFSAQRFLLVANIPANLLALCLEALPRPAWEPHLYYVLVPMALGVLVLSIIVALFDGHRIALSYYNSKYAYLNNNNKKHDDDGDADQDNGTTSNYKFENNNEMNSTDSTAKKVANGTANGTVMNGKHYQTSSVSNYNNQQKVRNRRGANKQQQSQNSSTSGHQMNGNVKKSQIKSTMTTSSSTAFESNSKSESKMNGSINNYQELYSPPASVSNSNWNHVAQSSEFIRQDSSSSEHSNRSSDSSTSSMKMSKANGDMKKSSNDSLNEPTSNNNSSNNSPNANRPEKRKTKREPSLPQPKQTTEQPPKSETVLLKSQQKKQPIVATKSNTKTTTISKSEKKEKSSKSNLNNSANDSLKSSLESLSTSTSGKYGLAVAATGASLNEDFVSKTRSATLPLSLNDSNNNMKNVMDSYVSETNISACHQESSTPSNRNLNQTDMNDDSLESLNHSKPEQIHSNKYSKEQKMEAFRTNKSDFSSTISVNNQKASGADYFGYFEPNNGKDIWDSPITSFDTEMAMSQLVKQTEEFAAIDEKITSPVPSASSMQNRSMVNHHHMNRRYERSGNKFQNVNDTINNDKWEIGEWSNDLLLDQSITGESSSKHYNNNHNTNSFGGNFEASSVANMKKFRFSPSSTINYQEFRNSLNDNNNSSRFLKSAKMYAINDVRQQQTSPPPSFASGTNLNSSLSNNSSTSLTNTTTNTTTTTFSPVIGRPPTSQSQQTTPIQRSKLPVDRFDDNFIVLNTLDSGVNKAGFLGNFDSLLDASTKAVPFNQHQQTNNNNSGSLSGSNSSNTGAGTLGSFLHGSEPWNSNSISSSNTLLDSFLSNQNHQSTKPMSGMFNLPDNNSVWSSSTSNWPNNNNVSTTSSIFSQFQNSPVNPTNTFCTSLSNDDCMAVSSSKSKNWPMSSSSSIHSIASNHRNIHNVDYHHSNRNETNAVWSPFESFNYQTTTNFGSNVDGSFGTNGGAKKLTTTNRSLDSTRTENNGNNPTSESTFDSQTVFELFGGKSPWSPLSSSPQNDCTTVAVNSACSTTSTTSSVVSGTCSNNNNNNNNFLSPSPKPVESLFGRFSQNSTPTSSSSVGGSSSSTTSGNGESK